MTHHETDRIEAFSDAVIAIIMTIMVLELHVPEDTTLEALRPLIPVFFSYVLSFIYLAIYWNNHHHLIHATKHASGGIMWANLHLLFWLSLIPFATAWLGENHRTPWPVAVYGLVLLMCAVAYWILQTAIVKKQGLDSVLKKALGYDFKGKISLVCYMAATVAAFYHEYVSYTLFILVAILWIVPDKRIAKILKDI